MPARERERRLLAVHGATEAAEFLQAVFSLLQGTVACDFALANLRNLDGLPLVAVDSLGREFGPEYMERFFQLNPTPVSQVMLRPGRRLIHTKDSFPSDEELKALPFYREFMLPENWRHSVALLFWGLFPPVPQNSFCVFRSEDQPDFNAAEVARLRALHPHIGTALKRLRKNLKTASSSDRISVLLETLPASATLLEWDLRITHQNRAARRSAAMWAGRHHENTPRVRGLPGEILAACREMKAEWAAALHHDVRALLRKSRVVPHPERGDLCAEITLILQQDSLLADPAFLVQIRETNGSAPMSLPLDGRTAGLSPAERETALLAIEGCSNEEIAQRLGISIAAVKMRLHGVFRKVGVRNRGRLAALLR